MRQVRWREPGTYMDKAVQGQATSNENEVGLSARPFEFMMNALRLKDGFELQRFAERTGLTLASIQKPLAEAEAKGLLPDRSDASSSRAAVPQPIDGPSRTRCSKRSC